MNPSSQLVRSTYVSRKGRPAATITTGLFLLLAASACSWSVPADPGLNSKLRSRSTFTQTGTAKTAQQAAGINDADDPGAAALYYDHCSRCHAPFAPTYVSAGEWPRYVRRYAPRAGLYGADRQRVLTWLQANAYRGGPR